MAADSDFVFSTLEKLIRQHAPKAEMSGIDDIVVSYVVGVVEDAVAGEPVDIEGVRELVAAYEPAINNVPEQQLEQWASNTVLAVKQHKEKGKITSVITLDSIVSSFTPDTKTKPASVPQDDPDTASSQTGSGSAQQRKSSNSSSSTTSSGYGSSNSSDVDMLLELFPNACRVDAERSLLTSGGDVQEACSLMLDAPPATRINTMDGSVGKHGPNKLVDDKTIKASIINRYSFVDNDEDRKEHRPLMHKWEGKKMVRYRDNKVVSLKGERYTEIKKEEPEDLKKTYVNLKPGRQYRFH